MLTCVFHPIDPMQVVEEDVAMQMVASGVWFDSPADAENYRTKVENEIKEEQKVATTPVVQPKLRRKGNSNERR